MKAHVRHFKDTKRLEILLYSDKGLETSIEFTEIEEVELTNAPIDRRGAIHRL